MGSCGRKDPAWTARRLWCLPTAAERKPLIECGGAAEDAVLLKNQEYWEIENLEITNTGMKIGDSARRASGVERFW